MTVFRLLENLRTVPNKSMPIKLAGENLNLIDVVKYGKEIELRFSQDKGINIAELGRLLFKYPDYMPIYLCGVRKYYILMFNITDKAIYL